MLLSFQVHNVKGTSGLKSKAPTCASVVRMSGRAWDPQLLPSETGGAK